MHDQYGCGDFLILRNSPGALTDIALAYAADWIGRVFATAGDIGRFLRGLFAAIE
jgi:hypothetical protein